MSITEKQAVATSTTKANNGGLSGLIVPAVSAMVTNWVETRFMIDLPIEVELLIVSVVTCLVTYGAVWKFPNKPKES